MAFWNREERLPEVMQPYGPYQDVRGQLDQVYNEAQNRNAQRINQMYANVGMNPRGAPATAARARGSTDIENQRAQLGYQSYYDWLRGKQLVSPQIQPSGASTLAAPFVSGIGQAAGPGIVAGATKALGQGWDWAFGGSPSVPSIGGGMYSGMSPSTGMDISGGYQPDYSGVGTMPDFSAAYQEVPWEYAGNVPDFSEAFNEIGGYF